MTTRLLKRYKILLIGDVCIDRYHYGICQGLSPEAPVPIFKIENTEDVQGMAGNVLKNLQALGCDVSTIFGQKQSIKTRFVDIKSQQHLLRIDQDVQSEPVTIPEQLSDYEAVVISDYNKGSLTEENIQQVLDKFRGPIFVDTKKTDLSKFGDCYVKINDLEFNRLVSTCKNLIVTLGHRGAQFGNKIYPAKKVNVIDVCGAGDTFLSALCYAYLHTTNIDRAIEFANAGAACVVSKLGTQTPTMAELKEIKSAFLS